MSKNLKSYKNRYASIDEMENGSWSIYNDVTGLFIREVPTYTEAITAMREMANYYNSVEYGRNGY
jgi:hypothetical protein